AALSGRIAYRQGLGAVDWHNFGNAYLHLAKLLRRTQRFAEADDAIDEALRIYEQLVDDFHTSPDFRETLFWENCERGTLRLASGRIRDAEFAYQQAVKIGDQMVADFPASDKRLGELARFLVTCPKVEFRNGGRAVELTKEALKLARTSWLLETLG